MSCIFQSCAFRGYTSRFQKYAVICSIICSFRKHTGVIFRDSSAYFANIRIPSQEHDIEFPLSSSVLSKACPGVYLAVRLRMLTKGSTHFRNTSSPCMSKSVHKIICAARAIICASVFGNMLSPYARKQTTTREGSPSACCRHHRAITCGDKERSIS